MVICLERGADLHKAQLMPLPLTVCCFNNIQIGFTFLVPAHPGSPGQWAVKRVCVCVCYYLGPDWRHSTVHETPAQCHQSRPCVVDSPLAPCPQRRYAAAYDGRQSAALHLCNTHTPTHNQYLATTHCARVVLFRNFCGRSVTEGFLFAGAEGDVGFRFGVMTAHRKRHIYSCAN